MAKLIWRQDLALEEVSSKPMSLNTRPLSVTVVACLYIVVGASGFVFHFKELLARHPDAPLIELTELLGLVAGAFMLLRQNWARWLALAWITFHVILSAFHPLMELALHSLFLIVIAWVLLRPAAGRYFRGSDTNRPSASSGA